MPALGLRLCLKLLTGSAHRHAATLTLAGAPHSHHQHASPCIRSERCRRPMHDARPSRGQLLSSYSTPRVIHCAGDPCMTPAPHASVPDTVCRCIPCVYSTLTREGRADACVHRCSVSVLNIQLSLSLSLSRARSLAPSRSQSHRRTWPEARRAPWSMWARVGIRFMSPPGHPGLWPQAPRAQCWVDPSAWCPHTPGPPVSAAPPECQARHVALAALHKRRPSQPALMRMGAPCSPTAAG